MSMVPVTIVGIQLDPASTSVVLLAESPDARRVLPILIGPSEARAIAMAVAGLEPPRPGTHDLLLAVLAEVGCRLEDVAITELVDGTFHAELFVESAEGLRCVSARPSDAMALAVRTAAPIHVRAEVFDEAGIDVERQPGADLSDEEIEQVVSEFRSLLADADPEDLIDPGRDA